MHSVQFKIIESLERRAKYTELNPIGIIKLNKFIIILNINMLLVSIFYTLYVYRYTPCILWATGL